MFGRLLLMIMLLTLAVPALANDSAVEIAVGGIQARKEERVLMEKERLFISRDVVEVEYEFRNLTDQPVTTEIAFPIPPYTFEAYSSMNDQFAAFQAWVDGREIEVKKDIRAFVGQREITALLQQTGITIESHGWFDPFEPNSARKGKVYEVLSLPKVTVQTLKNAGTFDSARDEYWPAWEVRKNYHWTQTFPPHALVKIKHRYEPSFGYTYTNIGQVPDVFSGACMSGEMLKEFQRRISKRKQADPESHDLLGADWVSYILTTANTWKTPIHDFELIVEKKPGTELSFCWDGPVERVGDNRYRAHKTDFVPKEELKVYFFKEM